MQISKFIWAIVKIAISTCFTLLFYTVNAELAIQFASSPAAKISLIIFIPIYSVIYLPFIILSISGFIDTLGAIKSTNIFIKIFSILLLIYDILLIIFIALMIREIILIF